METAALLPTDAELAS